MTIFLQTNGMEKMNLYEAFKNEKKAN